MNMIPTCEEFLRGCEEFEGQERRDAMYKVATFLVENFWGDFSEMANGLGVLLLTWNQAFYRYGFFDFDELEECLMRNFNLIKSFRDRNIISLENTDEENIKQLFSDFLEALKISLNNNRVKKSPVAVAKALHLLAPNFFPLWDKEIANSYGCQYSINPDVTYIRFCNITKEIANSLINCINLIDKPITKRIDEYNYSKYTKGWI